MPKKSDAPMLDFDGGTQPTQAAPIVLSSNFTLPVLFSRGCLLPAVFGEPTGLSFFDQRLAHLPVAQGKIPANWAVEVEAAARNAFPIGLRLRRTEGPREITIGGSEVPLEFILVGDVDAVVFRSEQEKDRFLSWPFEDFDPERIGLRMQVDGSAFEGAAEEVSKDPSMSSQIAKIAEVAPSALRHGDAIAAVFVTLMHRAPASRPWMDGLSRFLSGTTSTGFEVELAPLVLLAAGSGDIAEDESVEERLWRAAERAVLDYPLSEGWPAAEVLDRIHRDARDGVGDDEALKQLETWFGRSRAILDAEADVSDLSDKDQVLVRRALLLLMLRGDVDSLLETPPSRDESTLRVGSKIYLLALSLAAARVGLRALPVSLKYYDAGKVSGLWLNELASMIARHLAVALGGAAELPKPSLHLGYESFGPLDGCWVVESGRERLLVRKAEVDPRLLRISAMSKQLGYELREDGEGRLQISVPLEGGARAVAIELLPSSSIAHDIVRFRCDVGETDATPKRRRPKRATHSKKVLQALLEANSQRSMSCRFALDPDAGAISALVDQPLGTMDEEEFRWHLDNVAHAAREGRAIMAMG